MEDASHIVSDTYRVLDAQYRGEVQPLFRFITNSPVPFSLLVVLLIVTIATLFAAFAVFKFIIYSIFLGIGMALWYGSFLYDVGAIEAGLLGLVVCLVVSEELMAFLYHLSRTEYVSEPMDRLRRRLSWIFSPYLRLTGSWGFIIAITAFTFSAGILGPVMAYFFNMRRSYARIAVYTGFTLQAIFWTSLYVFVIPVFPSPLVVTLIVFGLTGLAVTLPEVVEWLVDRKK